ncbi:MAG: PIN domain-containing protein, partial [Brevundimonas sp.]
MTKTIIVDASAAASWLLASQSTRAAESFLLELDSYHLTAPDIFQWEVGNLLLRQARRDPQFDLNLAYQRLDDFQIEMARPLVRRQL